MKGVLEKNMDKKMMYERYVDLILKWKDSSDLTASKNGEEIWEKHIKDSIEVVSSLGNSKKIIDLGTGAGFPSIPIKIENSSLDVTLLDSRRRKINFLNQVILELRLKDIKAVQARAEEAFKELGRFDLVISRATWELVQYLGIAINYLDKEGICIAMKGAKWQEELDKSKDSLADLNLSLVDTKEYQLSKGEKRCLLIFRRFR